MKVYIVHSNEEETLMKSPLSNIPSSRKEFSVEGPWNIGEPVHEVMTLMAIKESIKLNGDARGNLLEQVDKNILPSWSSPKAHNLDTSKLHKSVQQFVRGVIWPDDPEGLFFDEEVWMEDFSSGVSWLAAFNKNPKKDVNLTARSHFGDLQFFHSMASKVGLSTLDTKKEVLLWAKLLIQVSTGRISLESQVKEHPLLKKLLPSKKHQNWTIHLVFGSGSKKPSTLHIRQRALGALLHLVQDSCAKGHTNRENDTFFIKQFLLYNSQDQGKHRDLDKWANGHNLAERTQNTYGASQAIQWSTQVLAMIDQEQDISNILAFLDSTVFKLASETIASGSGDELI